MESHNAAELAKQLQTVDLTADTPPRTNSKVTPPPPAVAHKSYKSNNEPRVKMWEPPLSTINNQAHRIPGAPPPLGMVGYQQQHSSQSNSQHSSSPLPQAFSVPGPSTNAAASAPSSFAFLPSSSSSAGPEPSAYGGGYISAADRDAALTASIDAMMAQATELADVDMSDADVPGLKCRLLPHQVQGHAWMQKREKGEYAGGILADDMGLGKTVQMLALVVSSKAEARAEKKAALKKPARSDIVLTSQEADMEKCKKSRTTLIVAPLAVVRQWEREALEKTDSIKVYVHHGNARAKSPFVFSKYDIVVTTYTTAAAEFKNMLPGASSTSSTSKSKSKSTSFNSDSDDTDDSIVVVDSDSDDDGPVRPGQSKIKKKPAAPRKVFRRPAKPAPLFEYDWRRIVLDEAQTIKNHKAQCSLAACALSERAFSKWCLTGTPIQNNAYEMFSLIHFLRIPPFNDYAHFKEKIGEPLKSTNQNRVNWGMKRLCVVLQTIMLRRTKDAQHEGKAILQLPNRSIEIVESDFDDPAERNFYDTLQERVKANLRNSEKTGEKVNHIVTLCMLLRLRQACNHIGLVASKIDSSDAVAPVSTKSKSSEKGKGKSVSVDTETESDDDDDVKNDDGSDVDELGDELADLMSNMAVKTKPCSRCQVDLPASKEEDVCEECMLDEKKTSDWTAKGAESTKIRMTIKLLKELRENEKTRGEKTIIFSQFTSFLDLIEPSLKSNKFKYVRYDGSMRQEHREESLERIRSNPAVTVILISFKAGSTGLNLTCCNNVILCDLWWNPALEMQAFDRAYRLGQTKDVRIHKLVITNSVEQRILTLQEKKSALSKAALEGSKLSKTNNKLSKDELRYLFSGNGL